MRSLSLAQPMRAALTYLALPVAYAVSGGLGLLLAVPPGYATAIFPPAGLAVGAMFLVGGDSLPGIFLGSLALNLWVGYSNAHGISAVGVGAAVVIAIASTLQAAIGGRVLRRALGSPTPLDNGRDLLRFLGLTPLICLLSATLSLSALWTLGAVASDDLFTSWMTWWIGDTLGVLIVLPLMLVAAGEPRVLWRARVNFVALPIVLFFALFVAIFVRVSRWENAQSLLEFRMRSQHVADQMRSSLEEQAAFLEQLEAAFASRHQAVSRSDFSHLARSLLERFPAIEAVGWAPRIGLGERAPFEAEQRIDLPLFAIRERSPAHKTLPAAKRSEYYPVTYIEPLAGNTAAIGLDLAADPGRSHTILSARTTGQATATAPLRLLQENGRQIGVLLIKAVDKGPNGRGVVVIALRARAFVSALAEPFDQIMRVSFVDAISGQPLLDELRRGNEPSYERDFSFAGRRYRLETMPTSLYLTGHRGWQSWALLVAGVLGTGLLGALLMLGTGETHRFERLLDARTRDLKASHARLKAEMEEREQAQTALYEAQRMKAIGQLTGGIAHDFNNLLMVVNGSVERLKRELTGEKAARYLDLIHTATRRAETLTRQLLSFSQMRPLNPRVVDLVPLVRDMTEMLKQSLRGDIAIKVEVPDAACPVIVDPSELELAILNLALNAQDAMPEGGTLQIGVERARLVTPMDGSAGECIAIRVRDNGTGIPRETLSRVFEPFFTTKDVGKGSGLGLSQVYGFAKQSGGSATIESAIGCGTAVTLFLPISRDLPTQSGAASTPSTSLPGSKGGRVLVVEDDGDVARVLTAQLEELGYKVQSVSNADAALRALDAEAFDLMISDILMPGGISGAELARRVRDRHAQLAVLLMSGYSGSGEDPHREGFVVLRKPFDLAELSAAVSEVLRRRDLTRSGRLATTA